MSGLFLLFVGWSLCILLRGFQLHGFASTPGHFPEDPRAPFLSLSSHGFLELLRAALFGRLVALRWGGGLAGHCASAGRRRHLELDFLSDGAAEVHVVARVVASEGEQEPVALQLPPCLAEFLAVLCARFPLQVLHLLVPHYLGVLDREGAVFALDFLACLSPVAFCVLFCFCCCVCCGAC